MNIWHRALLGRSQQTLICLLGAQDEDFVQNFTDPLPQTTLVSWLSRSISRVSISNINICYWGGGWKVLVCLTPLGIQVQTPTQSVRRKQHRHCVKLQTLSVWSDVGGVTDAKLLKYLKLELGSMNTVQGTMMDHRRVRKSVIQIMWRGSGAESEHPEPLLCGVMVTTATSSGTMGETVAGWRLKGGGSWNKAWWDICFHLLQISGFASCLAPFFSVHSSLHIWSLVSWCEFHQVTFTITTDDPELKERLICKVTHSLLTVWARICQKKKRFCFWFTWIIISSKFILFSFC